ncbi:42297_t:CDS:2 [Gigaspora margarita]|uniref:42297_t:CDS:1 n=1 Tax=Gigaspora margarita TaxID=4874 RepID=A0ABN7UEI2_GIGMA|nr:42297_t:CDS:2 [Gigaspora margarita]
MPKLTLDIAKEIAYSRGGECLSERYINSKTSMLWKCAKGHEWFAKLSRVKNDKTWCPICAVENQRTRTIEDMKKFAIKKGGSCLATKYINMHDPLEWHTLVQKFYIPVRRSRQSQYNIDTAQNIAQERGGKCLSTKYVNSDFTMLWSCAKGHEWTAPLVRIKNKGRWCAQCAGNLPCGLMEAKEIAHRRGGMCLSTEYINLCVPMQWMCNKGHKWFASFNGIKHAKSWCPYCLNKHENLCREVITEILGPPSSIRRPDFLKTPECPRGLELDIYYPQYGFAIEVQGKQHEQYVKRFHKNKEDFEMQLVRDQLKRELCDENWIVLIEIWYYEDPHIVIPEYLKELGLIG